MKDDDVVLPGIDGAISGDYTKQMYGHKINPL